MSNRRTSADQDRRLNGRVENNVARRGFAAIAILLATLSATCVTQADSGPSRESDRQSLDDAWWTGPLLAAGAASLPQGHWLFEPYFFDIKTYAHYDESGKRRDVVDHSFSGSQSYLLYGLTDNLTVGVIPRFGYNDVASGRNSTSIRVGDFTVQAGYQLTRYHEGGWTPTMSLVVQETLPIGKYDRLGDRVGDGVGGGAYSTTIELHSQYYFWMPSGRILRSRLNLSYSTSNAASLEDVSVYGTDEGFRGRAEPGDSWTITSAWEYNATRHWVLAMDVYYQHDANTRVHGVVPNHAGSVDPFEANSGSSHRIGIAPAIEYNWSSSVGVIAGFRWVAKGRNVDATIAPIVAINYVH
ncbi:MAG: transporter [Tahibacter sp.]